MKELNKEMPINGEDINLLMEELSDREEMACKGHAVGAEVCGVN